VVTGYKTPSVQLASYDSAGLPVPLPLQAFGVQNLALRNGDPRFGYLKIFNGHSPGGINSAGKSVFYSPIIGNGQTFAEFLQLSLEIGVPFIDQTGTLVSITTLPAPVGTDPFGQPTSTFKTVIIPSQIPGGTGPGMFEIITAYPIPGSD